LVRTRFDLQSRCQCGKAMKGVLIMTTLAKTIEQVKQIGTVRSQEQQNGFGAEANTRSQLQCRPWPRSEASAPLHVRANHLPLFQKQTGRGMKPGNTYPPQVIDEIGGFQGRIWRPLPGTSLSDIASAPNLTRCTVPLLVLRRGGSVPADNHQMGWELSLESAIRGQM
jgi:hypothetical protein